MIKFKFMLANIKFILFDSEIAPLRLVLSMSAALSLLWFGVMLWYGMTIDEIENSRKAMFDFIPLWMWSIFIFTYFVLSSILVSLKIDENYPHGRAMNIFVSTIGVLLWTYNADLLVASRLEQGILTMMAAQWALAGIAWWIFIRDCYGR